MSSFSTLFVVATAVVDVDIIVVDGSVLVCFWCSWLARCCDYFSVLALHCVSQNRHASIESRLVGKFRVRSNVPNTTIELYRSQRQVDASYIRTFTSFL